MSASTTEERELSLVNKVELRIALADSDAKLSALLKTFLAPLLLKLASEYLSVRNKVISVCQHITTRLQSPAVELPVAALLKQFKDEKAKLVRHFDLLYAQQGFKRLSGKQKHELVPDLIKGISVVLQDATDPAGAQFFNLFLQALHQYEFPRKGSKEDDELKKGLDLSDDDTESLSSWFEKLILLEIGRAATENTARGLPGLTDDETKFLNVYSRPGVWDTSAPGGLQLKGTKLLVLKLLSTGAFDDNKRFMPALFASAQRDSNIADSGEDLLKHAIADVKLEDSDFINRMYEVYLGNKTRPPAATSLQIKILAILQRSTVSATFSTQSVRILELGIAGEEDGPQGREAFKLQTAVFIFANFFFRHGSKDELSRLSPGLVKSLKQFVQNQGWPTMDDGQDLSLRTRAYELIGSCAKAGKLADLKLLDWLFQSLTEDGSGREISMAIEHTLASMIDTFSYIYQTSKTHGNAPDGDAEMTDAYALEPLEELSTLLCRYMEVSPQSTTQEGFRRSARYIVARYANRCLPYDNTVGRWIDILAAGGASGGKLEIVEEGKKGLDPYWFSTLNSDRKDLWSVPEDDSVDAKVQFPAFHALFKQVFRPSRTIATWLRGENILGDVEHAFESFMKRHPSAAISAIAYCWRVFVNEALQRQGVDLMVNAQWERKVETGTGEDLEISAAVKDYVSHLNMSKSDDTRAVFAGLCALSFEALIWKDGKGVEGCQDFVVQMLSVCPQAFISEFGFTHELGKLLPSIKSNQEHLRDIAARSFGILAASAENTQVSAAIQTLIKTSQGWKTAIGATINESNGSIKALAFALSRMSYLGSKDASVTAAIISLDEIVLALLLNTNDHTLLEAAYTTIEQFSIFYVYGTVVSPDKETMEKIMIKLSDEALKGKIKAIKALGRLSVCLGDADDQLLQLHSLDEKLYKLYEVREISTQFTVGEAICCMACGWDNSALQLDLDIDAPRPKNEKKTTLARILDRTIKDCRAPKPALRKASVIWLLCLVQFCGQLPEVQERLRACQAAFGNCLAERDDLVQEAASRGLGIVYEKGTRELRDDLVKDLMKSFSSDKSNLAGKVDDETQLFDPGALRTGDGDNSITTYKDILSLASEIGNPGLVYQFMSLAANNAVWSNRAAFANNGLRTILSDSAVGGYLAENPKLYAKLFRYRFDPNANVQRSMNDIWDSLVKDSNATVIKYFDPIMEDLLANILTKEWRVRQACCDAIADLVQGKLLATYEKYLTEIWDRCFKVLDDIKESVRKAAAKLARVLSQILVRSLEAGDSSTKNAEAMLKQVLPFLLSTSGLESSAREVVGFSLKTILDIIKKAGPKALRPFVPGLVERMLALFTDLEPGDINYLHLNAAQYNITEEKLDGLRLSSVRSSPIMEAVDRCFDLLDEETMEQTAAGIERAMKSAVGLPTKLAIGNTLVSLSLRHRQLFKPHAGRFLILMQKAVLDRNDTASSTYAAACGYLSKLATDKQILKLVDFAKKLYLEDEDERHRTASADIVRAISKQVPDRFSSLSSDILPFVFIAKHDGQEEIKEMSTKTWDDNVGTMAISLHLREIMAMCLELLDSPRWNLKHSAARSIADAVQGLAAGYDGISEDQATIIWPALKKALEGKTWDGKEVVVEAFAAFVDKAKGENFRAKIASDVVKIAIREAKRQNKDYRPSAISALGKIAKALHAAEKMDWNKEVSAIVEPVVEDLVSTYMDKMDVDGRDAYLEDKRRGQTLSGCIEALAQSFDPTTGSPPSSELSKRLLSLLEIYVRATNVRMKVVELSLFSSLETLFEKLDAPTVAGLGMPEIEPLIEALDKLLFQQNAHEHMESIRSQRANALLALSRIPWPAVAGTVLRKNQTKLDAEIGKEPSKAILDVLRQVRENVK